MDPPQPQFPLNPQPHVQTLFVGNERQPVIVIDDFAIDPQSLIDFAATRVQFGGPLTHYPGPIAPLPTQYVLQVVNAVKPLVRQAFGFGTSQVKVEACYYGLATLRPEQLNLRQRHPHVDAVKPTQLAVLHYLCDATFGGTAFYRFRETGWETMDEQQYAQYTQLVQKDMEAHGPPVSDYVRGDNRLYEQIGSVEGRFNRVVIYRGRLLHSATIPPESHLSPDPRKGRLTANTFLTFSEATA